MKTWLKKCVSIALTAMFILSTGCGKNDEPPIWEEPDYPDNPNDSTPDLSDRVIDADANVVMVDQLIYQLDDDTNTCKLLYAYQVEKWDDYFGMWFKETYQSNLPSSTFNVPDKVTWNGTVYSVTSINLWGNRGSKNTSVKRCVIPSSVLAIESLSAITPNTLIVGANVRSVKDISAIKIFWLPNTCPTGYSDKFAKRNYASSQAYRSASIYPHLSSMFTVDGLVYIMTDPAERQCVLVDATNEVGNNLSISGQVIKEGITFNFTSINGYALMECLNIKSLNMKGVTFIGDCAFSGCSYLKTLNMEDVKTIGDGAFMNCSIASVDIPKSVTYLGAAVFSDCHNLQSVTFEDVDEEIPLSIANDVFTNTSLKKAYIGRNLEYPKTGYSPFYRNETLEEVEINEGETEISDNMFYGCLALRSVSLGDDIQLIGEKAFSGCSAMKGFKFGKSLSTIGADAFSDCTALISFTSEAVIPPTCGNQALDDINKWECTLYVPGESIELYKSASQWKNFLKIE